MTHGFSKLVSGRSVHQSHTRTRLSRGRRWLVTVDIKFIFLHENITSVSGQSVAQHSCPYPKRPSVSSDRRARAFGRSNADRGSRRLHAGADVGSARTPPLPA